MTNCRYTGGHDWYRGDQSEWCRVCWLVRPVDAYGRVGHKHPRASGVKRTASAPSPALRRQVIERDGTICVYCGWVLVESNDPHRANRLTLDHIIPRSLGGRNTLENLVVSCAPCNTAKGSRVGSPGDLGEKTHP